MESWSEPSQKLVVVGSCLWLLVVVQRLYSNYVCIYIYIVFVTLAPCSLRALISRASIQKKEGCWLLEVGQGPRV